MFQPLMHWKARKKFEERLLTPQLGAERTKSGRKRANSTENDDDDQQQQQQRRRQKKKPNTRLQLILCMPERTFGWMANFRSLGPRKFNQSFGSFISCKIFARKQFAE